MTESIYAIEQRSRGYWYIVERSVTTRDDRVVLAAYRDLEKAQIALKNLEELVP